MTPAATTTPAPTPTPLPTPTAVAAFDHSGLAGTRGVTLQWISWEPADWGHIDFVPLVDGSYLVSGRQESPLGDFVEIEGTATRVSDRELRFVGTVSTLVSYGHAYR